MICVLFVINCRTLGPIFGVELGKLIERQQQYEFAEGSLNADINPQSSIPVFIQQSLQWLRENGKEK